MAQVAITDLDLKDFIAEHASNILYFEPGWLDLITSLYGYKLIPLTTTNSKGRITGFLPLSFIQSTVTGKRLVSLPFADYCPLLAEDETSANDLVNKAIEIAKRERVDYLELRTGQNEALKRRDDLVEANLYTRWLIPLDPNPDVLWSRFPTSVRGKIRKAQRLGVKWRVGEKRDDMRIYHRLHLQTRTKKHGMPSQSLEFFLRLWDTFAPFGRLHLKFAEYEGQIIASSIIGLCNKTAQFLYGASDERYKSMGSNNLLTWEIIKWGCENGYQTFDQGRTAYDNPGLMQFKRNWAAVEEHTPYYYYPSVRGLASTSEKSAKYIFLTRCWRTLPLQISGPLGGHLYRHLG
jgi:CelD/BcsL family acetyltransferase involved in cellulose biosynthesis